MDELLRSGAVAVAAGCAAITVLAIAGDGRGLGARDWLRRRARGAPSTPGGLDSVLAKLPRSPATESVRQRLCGLLEVANRRESPERFAAGLGLATVATTAAAALAASIAVSPAAALPVASAMLVAIPSLVFQRLVVAGRLRQGRLRAELAPMLELVGLELSGGASPAAALESVLFQSDCELAATLRTQLILSRVAGSAPFEARLAELASRLGLAPLDSLATILGLSRDYGSGVGQGLKALAADLRRVQRRELIASSRRALNRILIPSAVGVLLPFMAILLFPALSMLATSFQ